MNDWFEAVKRDLKTFADPGTDNVYSTSGSWQFAEWSMKRSRLRASFRQLDSGEISVVFRDHEIPYAAFLSGSDMSDLLGLAGMILQQISPKIFLETSGEWTGSAGSEIVDRSGPALALLQAAAADTVEGVTKVVFVTADAGAGKTEILRQLVRRQAQLFSNGESSTLYLYINAQGRALARLDEAFATELQDLRASLTYTAVPALTRNGALIPVIDGFDELLGVLGYEDAFSSLRRFLEELGGRGLIIASARSTYYEQEFLVRASRSSLSNRNISVDLIKVIPWDSNQMSEFLEKRYALSVAPLVSLGDLKRIVNSQFSGGYESLRKPFFVAKTADLVLTGWSPAEGSLIDQLVDEYIHRERTEKLLDQHQAPLLSAEQIATYLRMVCDEMWVLETRSLDVSTTRELADLAFPREQVGQAVNETLRERASTMAFFVPASGRNRIEFEHQIFFSYFLGKNIAESGSLNPGALFGLLGRSALPEEAANFAATNIQKLHITPQELVRLSSKASGVSMVESPQLRENAGAIVASYFRVIAATENTLNNLEFEDLIFAGEEFPAISIESSTFRNIEFKRTDLTRLRVVGSQAFGVRFEEVTIDVSSTQLDLSGVDVARDVHGIKSRTSTGIDQIFRPDVVVRLLRDCGMIIDQQVQARKLNAGVLDLLERLLRKFERSNLFWPTDQDNRQLTHNPNWADFELLLLESGILTKVSGIPQKGQPREALRLNFPPNTIIAGYTEQKSGAVNIDTFWSNALERFPE